VCDIISAVVSQKWAKATGPDGIRMEAFISSGHRFKLCLSVLFNLFTIHVYMPEVFCHSTIIPIPKCKSIRLSDVNGYRVIALSNSIKKILDSSLLSYIELYHAADDYQFGFRENQSTTLYIYVFKNVINYYRQNGSHVFCLLH
jgi:midasin (ATPase involved in ribosome maturation)